MNPFDVICFSHHFFHFAADFVTLPYTKMAIFPTLLDTVSLNERIRLDSSQLFLRCYYYFASAVFVVQCISVGYQEQDVIE